MVEMTTIMVSKKTKRKLDLKKVHKRQAYEEIIDALLEGN